MASPEVWFKLQIIVFKYVFCICLKLDINTTHCIHGVYVSIAKWKLSQVALPGKRGQRTLHFQRGLCYSKEWQIFPQCKIVVYDHC